jgi:DNA-binding Lrp family transcriptional regulator
LRWSCRLGYEDCDKPTNTAVKARSSNHVSRNLDEIDLKILTEIQADGRITNVELAKRVGISPPPCLRRVRALEEEGYIHGYRGLLDARKLGFDVTVFAAVHLSSQAEADLRAFEEFVRAEPLVRECWMLSGEVDFILKCVAPDMATFQDFVTHLTAAPHVRNVRTSLVLHNSKYEAAVPLDVKGRR